MEIFGLSGWEPIVLLIVFLVIIGPQRLPEYTRNVIGMVRKARRWVDDSRETVESEMGIAVDDLRKYDPRQYDPRRIIREAWGDTSVEDILPDKEALTASTGGAAKKTGSSRSKKDTGPKRAPFDDEAT
ncbi:twin-arginine translocase TatA/TatE family subunit [Brachybacterium hainanense]|uniref:Twin-arginine translocase TatA/TatE family subunit n=1 Tax=Brachybacterium hainanense TaxID=1541174 RepID=A0ABV6RGR3_9MICO